MKNILLFILLIFSISAQAQMSVLGGTTGGSLDGATGGSGSGGGGGGGGGGSIDPWSAATAYALDDISIFNETVFIRVIAGTTATAPDQDITNWAPIGPNAIPAHVAATYYQVGQVVEFGGYFYTRLVAGISAGTPAADAVNWVPMVVDLSSVSGILAQANGGTGLDASSLANGEIFIGNGAGFVSATLTGTLNQVAVANGAGSITLSTPQDIHVGASPTFVSATFSGVTANEFIKTNGASGLSSVASIDLSSDITGVLPISNGGTNSSTALNDNRIIVSSGGAIVEGAALTDGQVFIGSTGSAPVGANLLGTANQVAIANASGSVTFSLPQDIHAGATPTFASATFSGVTASEFVKTDASSGLTSVSSIDAVNDISGILRLDNGGTGNNLSGIATGSLIYKDTATTLNRVSGWDVTADNGLNSYQTVTPTDSGGTVYISQNRSEVELDLSENSTDYNYTHHAIDTHFDRTGSGFDYDGQFTSLSSITTVEGANALDDLTGSYFSISVGNGTDAASADRVIAYNSSLSVAASSTASSVIGSEISINADGIAQEVIGTRVSATVNNSNPADSITLIAGSSTGNTNNNFISLSNSHTGDVGGNYIFQNAYHNSGDVVGDASMYTHTFTGDVGGNYSGFNQSVSGTVTGNIQGASTSFTGSATSMQGAIMNINGDTTGNKTGLSISLSGESDSAAGLTVEMSSQVVSGTSNDPIAISTNGGYVTFNSTATVQTGGAFQSVNLANANASIIGGSPRTVDLFGMSSPMVLTFDDDMSPGGFGLGTASVGYVAQLIGSGAATVDKFSGAVSAMADLVSTGGIVTDAAGFRTIGPLSLGGSMAMTNYTAFKMDTGANLGTNRWGVKINDAAADNYFDKSIIIGGGGTEKVSNSDVALEIASLKAFKLPSLTTAERGGLTPLESMFVYDEDLNALSFYDGSGWNIVGSGGIGGLNADSGLRTNASGDLEEVTLLDGEILIGSTGSKPVSGTITGTLNQVAVANGAGSITLSTPQDIHVGASPTFVSATFSGVLPNEFLKSDGSSGLTTVSSIDLTADVSTSVLPVANGGTNSSTALGNGRVLVSVGGAIVESSSIKTDTSDVALDIDSTVGAFMPPRMTTAERNALTPVEGMVLYNTTISQPEYYNGSGWISY